MADKRVDCSRLSDKQLRRLWEQNIRAPDDPRRPRGANERVKAAGRRLDVEMAKRWKGRYGSPERTEGGADV